MTYSTHHLNTHTPPRNDPPVAACYTAFLKTCNKKFTPRDRDAALPIREIDTALVIKTNHGNQGIYHGTFGLIGFVAFARSQNLTFPVKNSMVFMNPSDQHVLTGEWNSWLSRYKAQGVGRLPSKIQVRCLVPRPSFSRSLSCAMRVIELSLASRSRHLTLSPARLV